MIFADLLTKIRGVKGELEALKSQRATKARRREDLLVMPLPKSDLADIACAWVDERGKAYPKGLASTLSYFLRRPEETANSKDGSTAASISGRDVRVSLVAAAGRNIGASPDLEAGLLYLLADPIKKSIRRAIEQEMDYPEAGPPMKERRLELARLEAEIKKLDAQISEYESALADVKGA